MPDTVMRMINEGHEDVQAELVKLSGTFLDEPVPYDVIIDRMSHEIPYYRVYAKYAALNGCFVINNPFVWANDTKFMAGAIARKLGLLTPRTMVLPNKDVATDTVPDSFRNLSYPMDWQAIIDYIGSPAIFKDVASGGRRFAHRVNNVDDLIQRYDESGTRTMILQQVIESNHQYHCLVIGGEKTLLMPFSLEKGTYFELKDGEDSWAFDRIAELSRQITRIYGYDVNMTEFVVKDNQLYLINATNPSPLIGRDLMTASQFDCICREIAALAVLRTSEAPPVRMPVDSPEL
jgi:hypothetical protein